MSQYAVLRATRSVASPHAQEFSLELVDKPDEIIDLIPLCCRGCGTGLEPPHGSVRRALRCVMSPKRCSPSPGRVSENSQLLTSEVIKEAERVFNARQAGDEDERNGMASGMILNLCQIHSGAVHGRFWIKDISVAMTPMTDVEGQTSITMAANLKMLANSTNVICYVLKQAAWLYEERCAGPVEDALQYSQDGGP
jgi:hypothetical protein